MKFAGADLGNDTFKLAFGVNNYFSIKNSVSRRMDQEKRKDLGFDNIKFSDLTLMDREAKSKILSDLDVVITSESINGRFFVGDLAVANKEQIIEPGTRKVNNPIIAIPLITMLALNIPEDKKEEDFKVVCGLPITEYTADREAFKAKLVGKYKVVFKTPALKGREVTVNIDDVIVMPEGVAVIINQMLDDSGVKFRNKELREGHYGVIDIGSFTTDIPIIVNGKPNSDASDGIDEGIANYLDTVVRYLNEEYKITMTRSKLVEIIESGKLKTDVKGQKVDIEPLLNQQFEIFSNAIVAKVDNIWSNHFEIKVFYVVGGGAKALEKYLRSEMEQRGIKLTFIESEDPQMQNAFGYFKLAKQKFGAVVNG